MQLAVFVTIAFVFLVFLIVSLVLGEVFEHGAEIAHDLADLATGTDSPGAEGLGGPSPFGLRVVSAFGCGFGAAGAIATTYKLNALASSGVGVGAGLLAGVIVYEYARFLYSQQAGDVFEMASLEGKHARVSLAIPAGGTGEISFIAAGERRNIIARAADGSAVSEGTDVIVEHIISDRAVVRLPGAEEGR